MAVLPKVCILDLQIREQLPRTHVDVNDMSPNILLIRITISPIDGRRVTDEEKGAVGCEGWARIVAVRTHARY